MRRHPRMGLSALLPAVLLLGGMAEYADAQVDESLADSASTPEEERGNSLIPLPVIFYQPETGLGFGVTGVYILRSSPASDADSAGDIRADYGWGFDAESTGFYLSFAEAF